VPEFWGGFGRDYDENGDVSEAERFRWNDEELNGAGFVSWTPIDHPELGKVEIGGWKRRFTQRNPPPHLLSHEIQKYVPWMLWLAEISPRLVIKELNRIPLGSDKLVKVTILVENVGYLPTNITQRAIDVEIAYPVRAQVKLQGAELVSGDQIANLGHLKGSRTEGRRTHNEDSRKTLEYVVRITGSNPTFSITVTSEKAGVVQKQIKL